MQFSMNKKVIDFLYSYLRPKNGGTVNNNFFSTIWKNFFDNLKFIKKIFNTKINKIIRISVILKKCLFDIGKNYQN